MTASNHGQVHLWVDMPVVKQTMRVSTGEKKAASMSLAATTSLEQYLGARRGLHLSPLYDSW
jgi:hypothetical protein